MAAPTSTPTLPTPTPTLPPTTDPPLQPQHSLSKSSTNPPPPPSPPPLAPPPPPLPPPPAPSLPPPPPPPSLPLKEEEEDTAMEDTHVPDHQNHNNFHVHDSFQDFTAEEILKYQKYEADYASRLRTKYFSNKDIYGGDIFDLTVSVGDQVIKASRFPPTGSYADPKQSFVDRGNVMASETETSPVVANGNTTPPKKGS